MIEYFAYKKYKKHKLEKAQRLLNKKDEDFLRRIEAEAPVDDQALVILSGNPSPGPRDGALTPESEAEPLDGPAAARAAAAAAAPASSAADPKVVEAALKDAKKKDKTKAVKDGVSKRWSIVQQKLPFIKKKESTPKIVTPEPVVTPVEKTKEEMDIQRALDELSLVTDDKNAFSFDEQTRKLAQQFLQILKDLVNGVPTAYDDLTHFFDKEEPKLQETFDKLPSFLQKLVKQLPTKLTSSLAPELLAVATEAQAFKEHGSKSTAAKNIAKSAGVTLPALKDLVTKPGAIAGTLKSIMNVLKLRWPAFLGTNVLWSLGLFILLFVFWYCHKRGREVRMEKEAADKEASRELLVPGTQPEEGESSHHHEKSHSHSSHSRSRDGEHSHSHSRSRDRDREGEHRSHSHSHSHRHGEGERTREIEGEHQHRHRSQNRHKEKEKGKVKAAGTLSDPIKPDEVEER